MLAATPLLMLATGLRGSKEHRDVDGLYQHIVEEIGSFEDRALESGCDRQNVSDARYVLCTFIDEVVMNTPWGNESRWATQPLLLKHHDSTKGGEVVFEMIESLLDSRDPDPQFVEFLYVCLSLGLEGRYRVTDGGRAALGELRERLYRKVRARRESPRTELSRNWHGVQDRRSRLVREVPAWVLVGGSVLVASLLYIGLRSSLSSASTPVIQKLNEVRKASFEAPTCAAPTLTTVATAPAGPTLAKLLVSEPREKLEIIEDDRGKTALILKGEMFSSGSAEMAPGYLVLLDHIAAALDVVGGRVQVEGHSDTQRLRSLKFQDNYQLSAKRAENAARYLQGKLPQGKVSISFIGLGPDEPRYEPRTDPANQALNRRIEIVHLAEGGARS